MSDSRRIINKHFEGHSDYGASSMYRRFACLASGLMERGMKGEETDASIVGTDLHDIAADWIEARFTPRPRKLDLPDEKYREGIEGYVNFCFDITFPLRGDDFEYRVEEQLVLDEDLRLFGTCDFFAWSPSRMKLVVVDLKTGRWPIDVTTPQLPYYAAAFCTTYPTVPIAVADCHIYQPFTEGF